MGRLELSAEEASAMLDKGTSEETAPVTEDATAEAGTEESTEESVIPDEDPGEPEAEEAEDTTEDTDEDTDTVKEDEEPAEFSANFVGWTEEFVTSGELSDETREEIVSKVFHADVPSEMKDQFIEAYTAGLTAIKVATNQSAFDLVGGEEAYQNMAAWAQTNMSQEELDAYDVDATGLDVVKRDSVIKGLHARFQQATGSEPDFEPDLSHNAARAGGEPIIGSRQELVKIQRTEEYKKDPAVRAKVARQLKQSMETGKYLS